MDGQQTPDLQDTMEDADNLDNINKKQTLVKS